jgi:hypothetical protein
MGNGVYQSGNVIANGAAGWSVVGTGDFTADGTSDIMLETGATVVGWTMKKRFVSGRRCLDQFCPHSVLAVRSNN